MSKSPRKRRAASSARQGDTPGSIAMPDPVPNWLATMRGLDTKWDHGDPPNPTIQSWLNFIATTYPNMAAYCNSVSNGDYFSWCGLTVGYCMAKSGIVPVFGSNDD